MDTKTSILRLVAQKKRVRTADVVRLTGISRQAAAKHLRELVGMRRLSKEGSTHRACYLPFDPQRTVNPKQSRASLRFKTRNLEEDRVWDTLARKAHLSKHLSVFDKTEIRICLSKTTPGGYVSRSEARRLLFGLEKFKRILIDFRKVKGIGQGFADEIFRVFHRQHPSIHLEPVSMTPSVAFFVKRALTSLN